MRWASLPILLLDVPLDSKADAGFVEALAGRAPAILATVPDGDLVDRVGRWPRLGAQVDRRPDDAREGTDLFHLRRHVFLSEPPPARSRAGDVRLFSAPGEGREAVEIVRRILDEAEAGVPFDEMAVFLRTPQHYLGLLEHACARAGVPAYFDRGIRRPDPAGRAFIALLSCAVEGLSARRFDEYLSLGQVPPVGSRQAQSTVDSRPPAVGSRPSFRVTSCSLHRTTTGSSRSRPRRSRAIRSRFSDSDDEAIVAGMLRAPWKWEELVVESAVVGGRTRADGGQRWRRRLDGLAADYRLRIDALKREEPESARIRRFERDLTNLRHLREFALPIVDDMAAWPDRATWGEWLDRAQRLARQVIRRPDRVLETLASLRPMADGRPRVARGSARRAARSAGRARLGAAVPPVRPRVRRHAAPGARPDVQGRLRARAWPSASCRSVRTRIRCCSTSGERSLGGLADQDDRKNAERLLLKLAIGAATERLYLSYPRLDVAETRARVPSFYALDVVRAITGACPITASWPGMPPRKPAQASPGRRPKDPARAIDDLEHDLASLKPLLDSRDPASVRGHAHYLLQLNESLRRSVISRWARGRKAWAQADGLIRVAPAISRALEKERLGNRPYSLSALQRFSSCPYQFLLATIYRLEPRDEPEPLVRLDPLTRGSLFHRAQAEFYRAMEKAGALPVTAGRIAEASEAVDAALDRVAAEYEEQLAPAIPRVWQRRDRRAAPRSRHLGPEDGGRPVVGAGLLRVQLRPDRRRTRRAQPAGSGHDRRPVRAARIGGSHRAIRKRRDASRHRPQDRKEPRERRI